MCFLLMTFVSVQKLCWYIFICTYAFFIRVLLWDVCIRMCRSVLVKLHPIVYRTVLGECTVPVLNATFCFLGCFAPGPSFGISDSTWRHRSPLCNIKLFNLDIPQGSIRLCNWLSLRRLVSWINHLPPLCLSTFWKSTFKQQLGCRFDR